MELLWIDIVIGTTLNAADEKTTVQFYIGSPQTPGIGILPFADPRVFAQFQLRFLFTTSGAALLQQPLRYDMQSKDGFGYLLASDAFNVAIKGDNTGVTNIGSFKMFYRFVDIPLAEFVGIVQSTQQA